MDGKQTNSVRQHFICHGCIISHNLNIGRRSRSRHVRTKRNRFDTCKNQASKGIGIGDMGGSQLKGGDATVFFKIGERHDNSNLSSDRSVRQFLSMVCAFKVIWIRS